MIVVVSLLLFALIAFAGLIQAKQMANSSIPVSNTPTSDHIRLARLYHARAAAYLRQSREHEQMARQIRRSNHAQFSGFDSVAASHCECLARHLKQRAARNHELEQQHKQLALTTTRHRLLSTN